MTAPPPATRFRLGRLLFPRGVRVVHFVLVPAIAMGMAVAASRVLDSLVGSNLTGVGSEVYQAVRTVAIALVMSSIIAFLAIQYRSSYEARLQAHNEALEATRDFLSRIIEGSAEAIITRDVDGRVTSWNPAAEAIYGFTAEEMLGRGVDLLIPPDPEARSDFERVERALARGETVRSFEASRIRKDGKPITVAITMSPIYDRSGQRAGTTGIVRDVTALKEMEARLLERETLAAVGE
ncbi:MAG TPA: PAS domain S-box protein, partial [Actinomycetota bacterium]|nr:PAS domain S-box protein [Actinomycetota bacterium]